MRSTIVSVLVLALSACSVLDQINFGAPSLNPNRIYLDQTSVVTSVAARSASLRVRQPAARLRAARLGSRVSLSVRRSAIRLSHSAAKVSARSDRRCNRNPRRSYVRKQPPSLPRRHVMKVSTRSALILSTALLLGWSATTLGAPTPVDAVPTKTVKFDGSRPRDGRRRANALQPNRIGGAHRVPRRRSEVDAYLPDSRRRRGRESCR